MKKIIIELYSSFVNRIMKYYELNTDSLFSLNMDQSTLSIKGVRSINDFNCSNIIITTTIYTLQIKGNNLLIEEFNNNITLISGEIESIQFISKLGG